ncbi:MAG: MBL fold metallo-hydrolase [Bacteroidia bacterium]
MKVQALGHAGLMVEYKGDVVLMDPWFSLEGNFQASWFQYPDNSHLLKRKELFSPTAILISHEHMDHCDPWFLSQVEKHVPVIIPKYPSPILKEKILQGGKREIIEYEEWEEFNVTPNIKAFFVSEPPMNHDSAIVIRAGRKTLLNMNDARLFPMQLKDIKVKVGGHIDLFAFQGSGASWFPMVYNFSDQRIQELREQKRKAKFNYCLKAMKIVEPTMGMPFAGPPCFLDSELFPINRELTDGIFPDQSQVNDFLKSKGVENVLLMFPGDEWNIEEEEHIKDHIWDDFDFQNRVNYIKGYKARREKYIKAVYDRHPHPTNSLWNDFKEYFERVLKLNQYFNEKINMKLGFEITGPGGGNWYVDFRKETRGVGEGIDDFGYCYTFESRWLPPILKGEVPWEDFFLSLRFKAKRNPDVYNDHLLGLLKFTNSEALKAVEDFENQPLSEELIKVHSEGKTYMVSRYCPHAGNDMLETGEVVEGGYFRCLAHHYDFSLETGECVTSSCPKLKVKRID